MSQDHPNSPESEGKSDPTYNPTGHATGSRQDILNAAWLTISRNETVLWWGHPSIIPHLPVIMTSVLAAIAGIYMTLALDVGLTPLLIVPVGIVGAAADYARIITTFYVVTDDKIVRKTGILRRDTIEVRYENIEHSRATQSIWERLFGFGDIKIATAGTDLIESGFKDVGSPRRVSNLINQKKDDAYESMQRQELT